MNKKIFLSLYCMLCISSLYSETLSPYTNDKKNTIKEKLQRRAEFLATDFSMEQHKKIQDFISIGDLKHAYDLALVFYGDTQKNKESLDYVLALVNMSYINGLLGNYSIKYHEEAYNILIKNIQLHDFELAFANKYLFNSFLYANKNLDNLYEYTKSSQQTMKKYFDKNSIEFNNQEALLFKIKYFRNFNLQKFNVEFFELTKKFEELTGRYNLEYANLFHIKAELLLRNGEYKDSEIAINKFIELAEPKLSKNHYIIGFAYELQAKALFGEMDYIKAAKSYNKSAEYLSLYPEFKKNVAAIYNNLGIVYKNSKNYELSIYNFNKSIEVNKEVFGEGSIEVINNLVNLAGLYYELKDYTQAIKLLDSAYILSSKKLGEYSNESLNIKNKINALKELM